MSVNRRQFLQTSAALAAGTVTGDPTIDDPFAGMEGIEKLTAHFADLQQTLSMAYPEHEAQNPISRHATPRQPGYGEHAEERITIHGPDFALREILKAAEAKNLILKHKNDGKNTLNAL
ncbi:MAG: twin-arginine translocation signal domain-containing protein [Rickettsiales bacterium]|nr:twin-arginine translocation signal domain-containing protein [Rickettsiales bacterium]